MSANKDGDVRTGTADVATAQGAARQKGAPQYPTSTESAQALAHAYELLRSIAHRLPKPDAD